RAEDGIRAGHVTGVQTCALPISRADFLSLRAPLDDGTRGLMNRERLARMKRGAFLVNLARGGLVESLDAVHEALESGRLGGAGRSEERRVGKEGRWERRGPLREI